MHCRSQGRIPGVGHNSERDRFMPGAQDGGRQAGGRGARGPRRATPARHGRGSHSGAPARHGAGPTASAATLPERVGPVGRPSRTCAAAATAGPAGRRERRLCAPFSARSCRPRRCWPGCARAQKPCGRSCGPIPEWPGFVRGRFGHRRAPAGPAFRARAAAAREARRAWPTNGAKTSRNLSAFSEERSISYPEPSRPKVTVSVAVPPSRSSTSRTWIFWAMGASNLRRDVGAIYTCAHNH